MIQQQSPSDEIDQGRVGRPVCLPFLKWAGGKRWLAQNYSHLIPSTPRRHIEPFAGSAAVFFATTTERGLLNDANSQLIATYRDVKHRWRALYDLLREHAALHSDDYYYEIRSHVPRTQLERSARFLYLNRSCWNGLYRVNKKGIFNVPRGTKDTIVSDRDDFKSASHALRNVELTSGDFADALLSAREGDFVLADPPYTVAHNLNGFVKYNDHIFSWSDQIRLRDEAVAATSRGAKVLVTNADHSSVIELYKDLGKIVKLSRSTVISGSSSGRPKTTELAICMGY